MLRVSLFSFLFSYVQLTTSCFFYLLLYRQRPPPPLWTTSPSRQLSSSYSQPPAMNVFRYVLSASLCDSLTHPSSRLNELEFRPAVVPLLQPGAPLQPAPVAPPQPVVAEKSDKYVFVSVHNSSRVLTFASRSERSPVLSQAAAVSRRPRALSAPTRPPSTSSRTTPSSVGSRTRSSGLVPSSVSHALSPAARTPSPPSAHSPPTSGSTTTMTRSCRPAHRLPHATTTRSPTALLLRPTRSR